MLPLYKLLLPLSFFFAAIRQRAREYFSGNTLQSLHVFFSILCLCRQKFFMFFYKSIAFCAILKTQEERKRLKGSGT